MQRDGAQRFAGKAAFITGASRGIGKAIALRLADEGCHVAIASRSRVEHPLLPGTLGETVEAIEARGGRAIAFCVDVRDARALATAVDTAARQLGGLDIAIHNAGALWWKPTLDTPIRKFDWLMQVNGRGAHALARAAIPHLLARGGGHFLTLSPPLVAAGMGGMGAYLISKFGMTLTALAVAQEHRDDGIAGNALWPETLIETAATRNFGIGSPRDWYKVELVADAAAELLGRDPRRSTERTWLCLDLLRDAGVQDFRGYRCDPEHEPPLCLPSLLPTVGGNDRADGSALTS